MILAALQTGEAGYYAGAAVALRATYYAGSLGGAGLAFFALLFGARQEAADAARVRRWAAGAALLLGVGYAPLYPSLTLLSTAALPEAQRPTAIGVFSAATSLGMAAGAAGGGLLIAASGSVAALVGAGVLQLLVLPATLAGRRAGTRPSAELPVAVR